MKQQEVLIVQKSFCDSRQQPGKEKRTIESTPNNEGRIDQACVNDTIGLRAVSVFFLTLKRGLPRNGAMSKHVRTAGHIKLPKSWSKYELERSCRPLNKSLITFVAFSATALTLYLC